MAIFAIAAMSVFGMQNVMDNLFSLFQADIDLVEVEPGDDEQTGSNSDRSYILYYDEKIYDESGSGYRHTYKQYYIVGSENSLGLVDNSGNVLLPHIYQDILILPNSYILKENDVWHFYSQDTLERLDENDWDEVAIELSEQGKIISDMVKVCRDGAYGATNHQGEIIISPRWQSLDLYTYEALWPLLRVQQDELYGFIDNKGDTIISVSYDYAQLDVYTISNEDINANESTTTLPIIYVCQDGNWGGILRESNGRPSSVDWDIEPSAEVLADHGQAAS